MPWQTRLFVRTLPASPPNFDSSRFSRILDLLQRPPRSYPRTSRQSVRTSESKPTASIVAFQESWSGLVRSGWTSLSGSRSRRVRWNCVVLDRHSLGIRQAHNVVHFMARGGRLVRRLPALVLALTAHRTSHRDRLRPRENVEWPRAVVSNLHSERAYSRDSCCCAMIYEVGPWQASHFLFTPLHATESFREDSYSGVRLDGNGPLKKVTYHFGCFEWLFDSYQMTGIVDNSQFCTWNL